jgi:energy-coupling factor transporter ATP-binding protein EcfA2
MDGEKLVGALACSLTVTTCLPTVRLGLTTGEAEAIGPLASSHRYGMLQLADRCITGSEFVVISSIEINGLRGIRKGKLSDLTPLVVLVGPNGAGKSTVLDAIMIAASSNVEDAVHQAVERRQGLKQGTRWLLTNGGTIGPAVLVVSANQTDTRTCSLGLTSDENGEGLGIAIEDPGPVNTMFSYSTTIRNVTYTTYGKVTTAKYLPFNGVSDVRFIDSYLSNSRTPLHTLVTKAVELGLRQKVKDTVGSIIDGSPDIQILTEKDSPIVYLEFQDHALPVALAGDGVRLLLQMILGLVTRDGGIVLMEEPEVHLHPGAIRQCAAAILAAVKRKTQIVLTTHSLELIDALLSASTDEDLNLMSLYSMKLEAGELKHFRLAGPEVALSRTQIQDDLR